MAIDNVSAVGDGRSDSEWTLNRYGCAKPEKSSSGEQLNPNKRVAESGRLSFGLSKAEISAES
jgi:hypothetical protein